MFVLGMAVPRESGPSLTAAMSLTTFGVVWIGMAIAHGVLLRELPHGGGLVVAVLLGTFVGDTGAYLGGRLLGTRKLAPRISPNKTWEGLAVGVLFGTFAVWWYGLSSEWMGGRNGAILGVAVALMAPLGDLLESAVKRDAGTKDAGHAVRRPRRRARPPRRRVLHARDRLLRLARAVVVPFLRRLAFAPVVLVVIARGHLRHAARAAARPVPGRGDRRGHRERSGARAPAPGLRLLGDPAGLPADPRPVGARAGLRPLAARRRGRDRRGRRDPRRASGAPATRRTLRARALEASASVALCAPVFFVGLLVLYLFNPIYGSVPLPAFFDAEPAWVSPWSAPWDWFRQLLVPWLVLARAARGDVPAAHAAVHARGDGRGLRAHRARPRAWVRPPSCAGTRRRSPIPARSRSSASRRR